MFALLLVRYLISYSVIPLVCKSVSQSVSQTVISISPNRRKKIKITAQTFYSKNFGKANTEEKKQVLKRQI